MTVIDRIRAATADEQGDHRPELVAAARGALTAVVSWAGVAVLVLAGVLSATRGTASVGDALGASAATWLALGGARLTLGSATIALTPLLGLALLVLGARWGARRALRDLPEASDDHDDDHDDDEGGVSPLPRWLRVATSHPFVRLATSWVGGYAAAALLLWALSALGPLGVRPPSMLLPAIVVPTMAVLLCGHLPTGELGARLPTALRRGLVPGLRGAAAALAVGSALVVLTVLLHLGRVTHVQAELGAGVAGGALLTLVQVLALPNLGIWGLSWLAGSGYSVSLGTQTSWAESQTALLPMIPVLAAHPEPGPLPWVTRLAVLVPVAIGAWVARDALGRVSRLSQTSVKAGAVAAAIGIAAVTLGVLDALAGGSLGGDLLADVGVPALSLVLALTLTMGLGGLLVLALDWWRQRR